MPLGHCLGALEILSKYKFPPRVPFYQGENALVIGALALSKVKQTGL